MQVQRLGSDVQQLEAESQRLLSQNETAQPNGRSEASSYGGGQGGQTVHSLELLDFSPNWDFTLGGSKVALIHNLPIASTCITSHILDNATHIPHLAISWADSLCSSPLVLCLTYAPCNDGHRECSSACCICAMSCSSLGCFIVHA